jgi:hypothetical protein
MENPFDLVVTLEIGKHRRVVSAREIAHEFGDPSLAIRLVALAMGSAAVGIGQVGEAGVQASSVTRNAFPETPTDTRNALPAAKAIPNDEDDAESVAVHLASTLRDEKSIAYFRIVARAVPRGVISDALTRAMNARAVRRSRSALFVHIVRPYMPRSSTSHRIP